ncbi:MAG: hypothetical protein V4616_01765 [Bacteroidota bacterium]
MLRSTIITTALLTLLVVGCKKENPQPLIIQQEDPGDTALPIIGSRFRYYSDSSRVNPDVDLDNDGREDLYFISQHINSPSGHSYSVDLRLPSDSTQIIATDNYNLVKIMNRGDSLIDNARWIHYGSFDMFHDYQLVTPSQYSESENTYWQDKTGYIAIRRLSKKGVYKYGWLKISVHSTSVSVSEWSFQR